jgi:hypothetical protein
MSRDFVRAMTGKGEVYIPPLSPDDEKKVAALVAKMRSPSKPDG